MSEKESKNKVVTEPLTEALFEIGTLKDLALLIQDDIHHSDVNLTVSVDVLLLFINVLEKS